MILVNKRVYRHEHDAVPAVELKENHHNGFDNKKNATVDLLKIFSLLYHFGHGQLPGRIACKQTLHGSKPCAN